MTYVRHDRVKETTYTTGTGNLALNGAMVGSRRFSSVCNIGDTFSYGLQGVDTNGNLTGDWETGVGTYSAPNTITRTKVYASSNNGNPINLSAPVTQVWIGISAADFDSMVAVAASAVPAAAVATSQAQIATNQAAAATSAASAATTVVAKITGVNGAQAIPFQSPLTGSVPTNLWVKLNGNVDAVADFNADNLGANDSALAVTNALSVSNVVYLQPGLYSFDSTVLIPPNSRVVCSGRGAVLIKVRNNTPAFILSAYSELEHVSIATTGANTCNLVEVGSTTNKADRASLRNVTTFGAGNDGIQIINGNLGSLHNIISINNGRDGINFSSTAPDANNWDLTGTIDARSNGRDGIHLSSALSVNDPNASRAHHIKGSTQQNGRYGIYVGTISNEIRVYSEANGVADVFLDQFAFGNDVSTTAGFVTNNCNDLTANIIYSYDAGANYWRLFSAKTQFSGVANTGFRISNDDGTSGLIDFEKTGAANYAFKAQSTAQDQFISLINTANDFNLNLRTANIYPLVGNNFTLGSSSKQYSNVYSSVFTGGGSGLSGTASNLTAGTVLTNASMTGPITSNGNSTTVASQTGTGSTFAMSAAPVFTGNVGFGGATPTNYGVGWTTLALNSTAGTRLDMQYNGITMGQLQVDSGNMYLATSSGFNLRFNAAGTAYMSFSIGGGEKMRLSSSGSLLIGTTTDAGTAKLQVAGGAAIDTLRDGTGRNMIATTAPVVASGFGTSPSIVANNTAGFKITIGSSPGGSGTLTMPSASNNWVCYAADVTNSGAIVVSQSASTSTSITLQAYSRTTGAAVNFNAGDVIVCHAWAF